jgi:DNA repair protein RadC
LKRKKSKKQRSKVKSAKMPHWHHPGGKLRELGPEKLNDAELLSILISTGTKGKSAENIAEEILTKYGSFKGMANQPLEKFLKFKGLGDVKIIRIAAAFEIARRIVKEVLSEKNSLPDK